MAHAETWVSRLKASDPSVCTEVFDALYAPLLRYATRLTQDEEAAYDILQDVFFKLWERRATLNPALSLKALLFTMVRNRSLNHQRDRQRHETSQAALPETLADRAPRPDTQTEAALLGAHLHAWIGELPPRQREAFRLSRYEGLSHQEIAQVMRLTPRTVSNHIMAALVSLRDRLRAFESTLT